jgi:HD-like signal output (HDOD) protein
MMLIAANRAHPPKEQDTDRIEDARLAVGQLGEVRLQAIAGSMAITEERIMDLPPEFCWPQFWTFQRGVARLAQFTCRELEFYSLEPVARTAGQLHDLGKLILAHLHPAGFQAILEHARVHHVPLPVAENLFLGCTSRQIAAYFADRFGLSRRLANVMRWIDDPAVATEDVNLVAIISLARDLCHRNRVGASGDILREAPGPIEETAEWQILRQSLYPGFNLKKFEAAVQVHCALLRTELSGQAAGTVGEIASHASV